MSGFEIELPSSPDPLGEEALEMTSNLAPPPPSTVRAPSTARRFFHSAASSRFSALAGTSPRKRMFALDVGSEITPQTIYVTVEAGQDGIPIVAGPGGSSVNRRLFGSPTPQPSPPRRTMTTTTTIPLRGLTDDEGEANPSAKTRRRRSSVRFDSPAVTSTSKRRKIRNYTPKRIARKPRETSIPNSDALKPVTSVPEEQPTLSKRRGRPPKHKLTDAQSEGGDSEMARSPPKKRRGRPRKSLGPEEVALSEQNDVTSDVLNITDNPLCNVSPSAPIPEARPTMASDEDARDERAQTVVGEEEEEHDVWMNNILNDVAPGLEQAALQDPANTESFLSSSHAVSPNRSPSFYRIHDTVDGESNAFAPLAEQDDNSDAESHGYEETGAQCSELEYQESLPGEPNDVESVPDNGERSSPRYSIINGSSNRGDEPDMTPDPESFTMIGIDSMPTLRRSRNLSNSDPPEIGEDTSHFINKTLESLKEEMAESDYDEIDILVSRDQTPAKKCDAKAPSSVDQDHSPYSSARRSSHHTPKRHRKTMLPTGSNAGNEYTSVRHSSAIVQKNWSDTDRVPEGSADEEDSFSDIPEEALAAAESQDDLQLTSPRADEDVAKPTKEIRSNKMSHSSAQYPEPVVGQNSSSPTSSHYTSNPGIWIGSNDKKSDTPRLTTRSTYPRGGSEEEAVQISSSPHPTQSRTDSNRLLTPPDEVSSSPPGTEICAITEPIRDLDACDIRSSPPETAIFDQDELLASTSRQSSDTPANQQPVVNVEPVQERQPLITTTQAFQSASQRPALSPVVRIGRTLQNILSDPPSPSARSSILGSPFKGSVRYSSPLDGVAIDEALQNIASTEKSRACSISQHVSHPGQSTVQQSASTWGMALAPLSQIKSLVSQGAQLFTSPRLSKPPQVSDPFGPSSPTTARHLGGTRNSASLDRIRQVSHEGSVYSGRLESEVSDEDDAEARRIVHEAENLRKDPPEQSHPTLPYQDAFFSRAGQSSAFAAGLSGTREPSIDNDGGRPRLRAIEGSKQQSAEAATPVTATFEENAQSTISDDMGHPQQAEQSTTGKGLQSSVGPTAEEQSDEEDIWTIEANRTASSPRYADLPDESFNSFRKSGLSIDWRTRSTGSLRTSRSVQSPGLQQQGCNGRVKTPEKLEDYSLVEIHSESASSAKKPTPQVQKQHRRVDLSGFFSSSPNFLERQRRAKEAWLTNPIKQPTADIAQVASLKTSQSTEPVLRSLHTSHTCAPPRLAANASDRVDQRPASRTSDHATPDHSSMPRISPQKFTPRQEQNNDARLFESWALPSQTPTSDPAATLEKPFRTTTGNDIEITVGTPDQRLRPLPGRAASPSKSCLRSPSKPKTPGRLVDFTSSTVSSTGHRLQTQAGNEDRHPQILTTHTAQASSHVVGKENEAAMLRHATSDPSPPRQKRTQKVLQQQQQLRQAVNSPLSQSRWSRRHWLYLDELVQSYRRDSLKFQLLHCDVIMTSPSKRLSSSFLGKQVISQGETLILEQWHLDIADTFKKDVGGWPEAMILKRLFALIVGEERRRLGKVSKR